MFPVVSCTIEDMTGTEWKRLAALIVRRRTELGMRTTKALADEAGLTPRALGDLENSRRDNYSAGTKLQIERALRWEAGSIDAVLSGGEPKPLPGGQAQPRVGLEENPAEDIPDLMAFAGDLLDAAERHGGDMDADGMTVAFIHPAVRFIALASQAIGKKMRLEDGIIRERPGREPVEWISSYAGDIRDLSKLTDRVVTILGDAQQPMLHVARTTDSKYRKGRSDQGDADGEESQDV